MRCYTNELWKAEASSRPKQSLQPKNHLYFPERSSSLESKSNLIYFSAPTDRDLSHHQQPSCKTTQPLEKSDPVGLLFPVFFLFFWDKSIIILFFLLAFMKFLIFNNLIFLYLPWWTQSLTLHLFLQLSPSFWSRLYFCTSSQSSQFIDRNVRGLPWTPLSLRCGDSWWKPLCPSYHHRLSTDVAYKYSLGRSPAIVQYLSLNIPDTFIYDRWWIHSCHFLLIKRMTAKQQTHREPGTYVLWGALEISRVDETT